MNVLPSGDFYFTMKKEELKIEMERLDDAKNLRKWSRFGVIQGSVEANRVGTNERITDYH